MTILRIRTLGDPVLRQPARPLEDFDRSLRRLVEDMFETMYDAPGVGLAAPQVGISLRFFVYDDGKTTGRRFLANPEILEREGEQTHDEGCLSIPGPYHPTTRAMRVRVRGRDLEGRPVEVEGEGLVARILQHETDHLDGVLFIDRLPEEGRRQVMKEYRARLLEPDRGR
ncbi:MAG TPA: peptide deformylase [Actinomycetota bacterium]|nr:peptide deformylase [Actinomycetota bacterium]